MFYDSNTTNNIGVQADHEDETSNTPFYIVKSDERIVFEQPPIVINQQPINRLDQSTDHDDSIELEPEEEANFYHAVRQTV